MRSLGAILARITLERVAVGFFLIFFLLTPLTYKIQLRAGLYQEGIYVEPLMPFLGLSVALFLWSFRRKNRKGFWAQVKNFFVPHPIAKVFYLLMAVLALSWIYGVVLTGNLAWGDLLRLIKYGLYFLIFPLAIQTGRILGRRWIYGLLTILFLVGVIASIVSLHRIYQFVAAGNVIDFWQYSVDSSSVGFLGQYLDLSDFSIGQIPKAAHTTFGLYLSAVLAIGLVLLSQVRRVFGIATLFLGMGVVFAAILYTLSRGAVAVGGLVVAAGLIGLLWQKRFWAAGALTTLLVLELGVILQLNPEISRKFASTFPGAEKLGEQVVELSAPVGQGILEAFPATPFDESLGGRIVMWRDTIALLKSRAQFFLLGVGYSIDNLRHFTGGTVVYPHSLFLDLWVRGGLLALILGLALWLLLFGKTIQFWFSSDKFVRAFGFTFFGFLVGWFLDNAISGEQFFSDAPMLAFWGTLGLTCGWVALPKPKNHSQILMIGTTSEVGGGPEYLFQLLSHLNKERFKVVLAVPRNGPYFAKFGNIPDVRVENVAVNKLRFGTLWKLLRLAVCRDVDLIHSHGKGAGVYSRLVGLLTGKKVVHTWHGIHYLSYGWLARRIYLFGEKLLARLTTRFINVSRGERKEAVSLGFYRPRKAAVVPNGVDLAKFQNLKVNCRSLRRSLGVSRDDLVFVNVARFHYQKGQDFLVRTIPLVLKKLPSAKFVFVGAGERLGEAKRLARKLGVAKSCVFAGEREDVAKILSCSDVFVSPSRWEGLPFAVIEAMASGLPVVATKVVGNEELLKGVGVLVDFGDEKGFARALVRVGKSPRLRRALGLRGFRRVKKGYSLGRMVRAVERVYSFLC